MSRKVVLGGVAVVAVVIGILFLLTPHGNLLLKSTDTLFEKGVKTIDGSNSKVIAQNLTVPWEVTQLPNSDLLFTERSGKLQRIGKETSSQSIEGVEHIGEGGLLGLAVHPDFANNKFIYLYFTTRSDNGLNNRVERYRLEGHKVVDKVIIIFNIPGATHHDGGRLAFGPDKLLYITTGDAGNESFAQDKTSLAGKILRLKDDGGIPEDNPFGNAVYSYGHRNPQGLAWDDRGQLWATEHGRSGVQSGLDELNIIKKGVNYGWPEIQGDDSRVGMERPVLHSGPNETWAPASLAYHDGSLFFGGLRGEALYEAELSSNNQVKLTMHLKGQFGRVRAVATGKNDQLYITTSNTDGRGDAQANDDKIIRMNAKLFH